MFVLFILATLTLQHTLDIYGVPQDRHVRAVQTGVASVYWPGDGHCGTHRADGKRFTIAQCHIAHRSWPLGTPVAVCSTRTGRCVRSTVQDRGPFGACLAGSRTLRCKQWGLKIRKEDPGTWRGIADLSKCVWLKLGNKQGLQHITLYRLKKERNEV